MVFGRKYISKSQYILRTSLAARSEPLQTDGFMIGLGPDCDHYVYIV
jgi:hypothetical protein